jgi:hypothetical protein
MNLRRVYNATNRQLDRLTPRIVAGMVQCAGLTVALGMLILRGGS